MKCPKCGIRTDCNQIGAEIVMEKCGHTFYLEYLGMYDENDNFHDAGFEQAS